MKTQIEIVNAKKIITKGIKIESSQAALLDKLKIRPFEYKMLVKGVYDNGAIFNANILDITEADLLASLQRGISNMAAISLASGYVTKPAIPHMIANAFKNMAAVSFETSFSFPKAELMKSAASSQVAV